MPKKYFHPATDFWRKFKIDAPEAISHGIEDTAQNPLSKQIPKTKITGWHLDGNRLIAQTEMGEVVNLIDPGYILTGVDDNDMPILTRIET